MIHVFHENFLLAIIPYFFQKIGKILQNLSSVAVVFGTLRVKSLTVLGLCLNYHDHVTRMRKFRIDQDFLIKHWHMIHIMSVVFAEIYV